MRSEKYTRTTIAPAGVDAAREIISPVIKQASDDTAAKTVVER